MHNSKKSSIFAVSKYRYKENMANKSEIEKYDVFISYARKDYVDEKMNVIPGNVVSQIKELLTQEGISYWFDEEGIYSGQNFTEKIVTNIESSRIFLFLSTINSNESKWTCKEIATADELGKHIIPVRIDTSRFNNKVLFRIADLDFIDYQVNPKLAKKEIVRSIKAYLKEQEELQKTEEKPEMEQESQSTQRENEKQEKKNLFYMFPIAFTFALGAAVWCGIKFDSIWIGIEICLALAWFFLFAIMAVEEIINKGKDYHLYFSFGLASLTIVAGIHSGIYLESWWQGLLIGLGLLLVDLSYLLSCPD